jgi:hypothetical protein
MPASVIVTERLELVPATAPLVRAALAGSSNLAAGLDASVPATWPPEYLESAALDFTLARLAEGPEPELSPSIGVLRKCGFTPAGVGPEPGVIRFELTRADFTISVH